MKYFRTDDVSNLIKSRCIVTIGNFDGIHLGHRKLIEKVVEISKSRGLPAIVFSFSPHPAEVFGKAGESFLTINTLEEKIVLLEEMCIDYFIEYEFNKKEAGREPEEFARNVLFGELKAEVIVIGEGFRFGKNKSGDVFVLDKIAKEFGSEIFVCEHEMYVDVLEFNKISFEENIINDLELKVENKHSVEKIKKYFEEDEFLKEVKVSSSMVRKFISGGEMELVGLFLGKPYFIIGEVIHGKKLGRTIGFPTINIVPPDEKLLPPNGIYFTTTNVKGKRYKSITNVGINPTFVNHRFVVETFIFDFDEEIYGESVCVEFLKFSRNEMKCNSLAELKQRIEKDRLAAEKYFQGKVL